MFCKFCTFYMYFLSFALFTCIPKYFILFDAVVTRIIFLIPVLGEPFFFFFFFNYSIAFPQAHEVLALDKCVR